MRHYPRSQKCSARVDVVARCFTCVVPGLDVFNNTPQLWLVQSASPVALVPRCMCVVGMMISSSLNGGSKWAFGPYNHRSVQQHRSGNHCRLWASSKVQHSLISRDNIDWAHVQQLNHAQSLVAAPSPEKCRVKNCRAHRLLLTLRTMVYVINKFVPTRSFSQD